MSSIYSVDPQGRTNYTGVDSPPATPRNIEIAKKLGCDPYKLQNLLDNYPTAEQPPPANWYALSSGPGAEEAAAQFVKWLGILAPQTWIQWPIPVYGVVGFTYGPALSAPLNGVSVR